MTKKRVLGKGMASLIKQTPNQLLSKRLSGEQASSEEFSSTKISLISVKNIRRDPLQARKVFKRKELSELVLSIKEHGIIQPLLVARSSIEKRFELIAGERRLRAARTIGLKKVPVIIKQVSDKDKRVLSLIENVQRSNLNCIEEGMAYFKLIDEFSLTQEEVGKILGKERTMITNLLRLLKLPAMVRELLKKEELTFGHGKVLLGCNGESEMIAQAQEAVSLGSSVRELERKVKLTKRRTKSIDKNDQAQALKERLEKRTGYSFTVSARKNGSGSIGIQFSSTAECNHIFEFLMLAR